MSQLATKTTLAITSVVQCTPSSTRENAVAATASPAVSQPAIDAPRRRASVATHSARIAKARHAAAEWPEGNDQPRAWTSQIARVGLAAADHSLADRHAAGLACPREYGHDGGQDRQTPGDDQHGDDDRRDQDRDPRAEPGHGLHGGVEGGCPPAHHNTSGVLIEVRYRS